MRLIVVIINRSNWIWHSEGSDDCKGERQEGQRQIAMDWEVAGDEKEEAACIDHSMEKFGV